MDLVSRDPEFFFLFVGTCHASMACPLVCVVFSSCRSEDFDTLLLATLRTIYVQDVSRVCATALSINRFGVREARPVRNKPKHPLIADRAQPVLVPPVIQHTKRYISTFFVLFTWMNFLERGWKKQRPARRSVVGGNAKIYPLLLFCPVYQSILVPRHLLTFSMGALSHGTRFYNPGMPAETPTFNRTLCEESEGLADTWANAAKSGASKVADAKAAKFEAWTSPQQVREQRHGRGWSEGGYPTGWFDGRLLCMFCVRRCCRRGWCLPAKFFCCSFRWFCGGRCQEER